MSEGDGGKVIKLTRTKTKRQQAQAEAPGNKFAFTPNAGMVCTLILSIFSKKYFSNGKTFPLVQNGKEGGIRQGHKHQRGMSRPAIFLHTLTVNSFTKKRSSYSCCFNYFLSLIIVLQLKGNYRAVIIN
jgi:hypothetical protein